MQKIALHPVQLKDPTVLWLSEHRREAAELAVDIEKNENEIK